MFWFSPSCYSFCASLSVKAIVVTLASICLFGCSEPDFEIKANKEYRLSEQYILVGALSNGAKHTALVTSDSKLILWRNQDYSMLKSWNLTQSDTVSLAFSRDQQFLILGSSDSLFLFNIATGDEQRLWTTLGMPEGTKIDTLAISATGTKVLIGLNHGGIVVIDLDEQSAFRVDQDLGSVVKLLFVDGDRKALAGFTKGKLVLLDLDSKEFTELIETEHRITSLVAERSKLFISDALAQQKIMDYKSMMPPLQLEYSDRWRWFRHGVFLEGQKYLVTSSPKSELSLWDAHIGAEVARWQIHRIRPGATTIALSKTDTGDLVSLSSDAVLQYWPKARKIQTAKQSR